MTEPWRQLPNRLLAQSSDAQERGEEGRGDGPQALGLGGFGVIGELNP